jgi:hypothetical protein
MKQKEKQIGSWLRTEITPVVTISGQSFSPRFQGYLALFPEFQNIHLFIT